VHTNAINQYIRKPSLEVTPTIGPQCPLSLSLFLFGLFSDVLTKVWSGQVVGLTSLNIA